LQGTTTPACRGCKIMLKKPPGNIIIGYELSDAYAQISYMNVSDTEPETASVVLGEEKYNIPTAMKKKSDSGLWLHGKEALKESEDKSPVITRLLDLAMSGTAVLDADEQIDPVSLLALFVKRSLSVLTMRLNANNIAAFMFTVAHISPRMVAILERVAADLELPADRVYIQSYQESIYQYVIHQPEDLWQHPVLLFDYGSHMKSFRMEANKKTTPTVVFIEAEDHPRLLYLKEASDTVKREWDASFLEIAEAACAGRIISTIYLVGEGFKDEWPNESLKYLVRGRRVFRGNNLYSKGACFGAMEKYKPSPISKEQVFLGEDKLKTNIGIRVLRGGEESYFAILDAGQNWHECEKEFELILDGQEALHFIISPLTGGSPRVQQIMLTDLGQRPPRTTRLHVLVHLESATIARICVTDLGFGELFPGNGKEWISEIELSGDY